MSASAGPLLTPDEVAARLRVARRTVLAWARQGVLPCVVLSRGTDGRAFVRFEAAAVDQWVKRRRHLAQEEPLTGR
ncbi:MAG: helix-turn-helix domain-containing protein [Acidobacteriota bacterium]